MLPSLSYITMLYVSAPAKPLVDLPQPDDRVPLSMTSPMTQDSEGFTADAKIQDRVTLKQWDPVRLNSNDSFSSTVMRYF